MKRLAFLILLGLIITTNVHSQNEKKTRLSFVLSPQISWLNSDNKTVDGNGNLFGYNFGIVVDRFFDSNYAITTGLTVNSTGGKLSYSDFPDPGERTYKLKYIEVPFALKLISNDFHRSRFFGQFGLYSQINIKATDGDDNSVSDNINFFDLGYLIGGGMEYSLGGDTYFILGLKYGGGFMDITTNDIIDDKATLNRLVFQFGVIF